MVSKEVTLALLEEAKIAHKIGNGHSSNASKTVTNLEHALKFAIGQIIGEETVRFLNELQLKVELDDDSLRQELLDIILKNPNLNNEDVISKLASGNCGIKPMTTEDKQELMEKLGNIYDHTKEN